MTDVPPAPPRAAAATHTHTYTHTQCPSVFPKAFLDARKPGTVDVAEFRPVINSWTKRFVDLLVGAGADPAVVDPLKRNPLHVAAAVGNTDAMMAMLAGLTTDSAALQAIDVTGQNPMDLAISRGFTDTAKALGDAGAVPSPQRIEAYAKYYQTAVDQDRVGAAAMRADTGGGGWYEPGEPPEADTMSNVRGGGGGGGGRGGFLFLSLLALSLSSRSFSLFSLFLYGSFSTND